MKRTLLVFAAATAMAFLSTSCIKDWICKCTSVTKPNANYNYTYSATSKANAKADCENQQTEGRSTYNTADYNCEIQ